MNPSKKRHHPSPFPKFKTKRLNSEQKKTIKGTFIAEISIQDVCDETSNEGFWITESEASETTEIDVFESAATADTEADEEIYSPTESFRRSEKQQDDAWSLCHMGEDSSPTKGTVNDILPSPEILSHSDTDEIPQNVDRPAAPKIHPVLPYFQELKDFSSEPPCDETTILEYHQGTGNKSKFPEKCYQRLRKGLFDSTRIVDPTIGTNLPERFEWGNLSSISSSTQSSQHVSKKNFKSSEEHVQSKEFSGEVPTLKIHRKKSFTRITPDVPKTVAEEQVPSSLAKGPTYLDSVIRSKNLSKRLPQDNKEKLYDTPKGSTVKKFPKRDIFQHGESRPKTDEENITSQSGPLTKGNLEKSFQGKCISRAPELLDSTHIIKNKENSNAPHLDTFTKNAVESAEDASKKNGKVPKKTAADKLLKRKTLSVIPEIASEKRISAASSSVPVEDIPTESVETSRALSTNIAERSEADSTEDVPKNNGKVLKKTAADKLLKRKKLSVNPEISSKCSKEKRISAASSSVPVEDIIPAESVETSRALSTNIAERSENESTEGPATLNKEGHKIRKTTLMEKNLPRQKEKSRKAKRFSTVVSSASSKDSIMDFIVSTEDEESSEEHSSKISKRNSQAGTDLNDSEDSWKSFLASKMMKKKKISKKRKPLSEETEEEIASTPSSTTVEENSVEHMDTSESKRSNVSSKISNTETSLKETDLEREQSAEAESSSSSKIMIWKEDLKKRKLRKDSLEEKSLEVRIQEYKKFLKTVPIDDLSLKNTLKK